MNLPEGQILQNGKYKLTHVVGQGGFGITYKGVWNTEVKGPLGTMKTEVPVCVKEYFFKDYCFRDVDSLAVKVHSETGKVLFNKFKEKLIKEAKILSEVHHPYIVNVLEVFEENNTAYIAMEYISGCSLKSLLEKKGILAESEVLKYVQQIGEALQFVHDKNILHLDIKPSNILIDKNGNARLIDFGVSKRYDLEQEETSTTMLTLSKGFASIEQYDNEGTQVFSPRPDIYSLGATMYNLLTGKIPTESILRAARPLKKPTDINPAISLQTEKVILKAMQIIPANRFESIQEMMDCLDFSSAEKVEKENLSQNDLKEGQEEGETTVLYNSPIEQKLDDRDEETIVNAENPILSKEVVSSSKNAKKKLSKKSKYSFGISIFVLIGSAIGAWLFNQETVLQDKDPKNPLPVIKASTKIDKAKLPTEKKTLEENNVAKTVLPQKGSSQPDKKENKEVKNPRVKEDKQQVVDTKKQSEQPKEKSEVDKPSTPGLVSEQEVKQSYQTLVKSAKEKMAISDYSGAKEDLINAKKTLLTEEVVRLIIDCDAKLAQKVVADKIAQYEKKMSFGKFKIVRKKSNNRYGAIDVNGNERIPCKYLSVGISENGRAFEREDNLFDIYNSEGTLISEGLTYY